MSLQNLKKEVKDVVDILHAGIHKSFLQVDFNTFGIKVYYKLILSFFKELRNYKPKLFFVCHKNRQKHNQHFKLIFFTINLHFVTSNQIPTYRKTNLPLTSSICLVFLPLEMQGRLKPKYTTRFFTLKRNDPQTFKSGSRENPFIQCVQLTFYAITGRHYFP